MVVISGYGNTVVQIVFTDSPPPFGIYELMITARALRSRAELQAAGLSRGSNVCHMDVTSSRQPRGSWKSLDRCEAHMFISPSLSKIINRLIAHRNSLNKNKSLIFEMGGVSALKAPLVFDCWSKKRNFNPF